MCIFKEYITPADPSPGYSGQVHDGHGCYSMGNTRKGSPPFPSPVLAGMTAADPFSRRYTSEGVRHKGMQVPGDSDGLTPKQGFRLWCLTLCMPTCMPTWIQYRGYFSNCTCCSPGGVSTSHLRCDWASLQYHGVCPGDWLFCLSLYTYCVTSSAGSALTPVA